MHYYTRNLGDYAKKAGRLSMLQHGAYTLLLDACYDRERFPTESEAIEWTWASTPEEEQAVKFVLARFFDKQQDGTYVQSRVKEELALFKIGGIQNRLIAISREARKQKRDDLAKACDQLRDEIKNAPLSKTHEAWTGVIDALIKTHEAPPNQEPITNNQEPIIPPSPPRGVGKPDDVSDDVWRDFKKHRAKHGGITERVIAGFRREAEKAGWTLEQAMDESITQGWRGFKAEYVKGRSDEQRFSSNSNTYRLAMQKLGFDQDG